MTNDNGEHAPLEGTNRTKRRIPRLDDCPDASVDSQFTPDALDAPDILRAVARMSPLPMVLTDPHQPDDPLVFCNEAFSQLTGYTADELVGRNCRLLQGELTDPVALMALRDAIADRREYQVELWNYRKDGSPFWCSMFVGPVFDRDGRLIHWFGSQIDATARREADEAQARAQRMDTLGSMAAGIAHEFNNLMTVVLANAEPVRGEPVSPRMTERLARIEWAAHAAGRLTQQMLSFSGRHSQPAAVVDLNEALGGFDRLLAQVATSGTRVEMSLGPTPLRAKLDAGQLELALINLVKNASDASPAHSRIVVSTRETDLDEVAAVEVAVSDRGTGMPPEVAVRATEPFFTTKQPGQGTGLGLSMIAGFVQHAGGRLLIETEPGRGTTVRLVFPRAAPQGV